MKRATALIIWQNVEFAKYLVVIGLVLKNFILVKKINSAAYKACNSTNLR